MNFKKILCLVSMIAIPSLGLMGCHKAPELAKANIEKQVEENLNKNEEIDSISDLKVREVEMNKSDEKKLSQKYTKKIPVKIYEVALTKRDIEKEQKAFYRAAFALPNEKEWKLSFLNAIKKDEWKTIPTGKISTKHILKDIQDIDFKGFKKGYIGDEKNTKIKIKSRDTNLKLRQDFINMTIEVKNDFAKYYINAVFNYSFIKDKWTLLEKNIEKQDNWKLEFNEEIKPKVPTPDKIRSKITNKNDITSYIINDKYASKIYISKPKERADAKRIIYTYVVIATYNSLGDIEYTVDIPFEYDAGNWKEKDAEVNFSKATLFNAARKWKLSDKEYITIDYVMRSEIKGSYTKDGKTVRIKGLLNIDKKDNLYSIDLVEDNLEEGKKPFFNLSKGIVDVQKEQIRFNNGEKIFSATKQDPKEREAVIKIPQVDKKEEENSKEDNKKEKTKEEKDIKNEKI